MSATYLNSREFLDGLPTAPTRNNHDGNQTQLQISETTVIWVSILSQWQHNTNDYTHIFSFNVKSTVQILNPFCSGIFMLFWVVFSIIKESFDHSLGSAHSQETWSNLSPSFLIIMIPLKSIFEDEHVENFLNGMKPKMKCLWFWNNLAQSTHYVDDHSSHSAARDACKAMLGGNKWGLKNMPRTLW